MRSILFIAISLLAFVSCSKKEKHEESAGWKSLDDFHTIMAKAYHPLKDNGDLAPVKEVIGDLAAAANKLASEPLPGKVDNDAMKKRLETLKADVQKLATDISAKVADDSIKVKLTSLHDQFHKVMEAWESGNKKEDAEEDEEDEEREHDEDH